VRATNLGNWMVPEGCMWLFQGGPQSPGEIRALKAQMSLKCRRLLLERRPGPAF
jgi:hypothetical protein